MEYYSAIKKIEMLTFEATPEALESTKYKPYAHQGQMFPT